MSHPRSSVVASSLLVAAAAWAAPAAPRYRLAQTRVLGGEGGWDYLTFDPAGRRLFVARGERVLVLDARSLKSVGEIAGLGGVHGAALAPELGRGFISDGRAGEVVIFDLKTLKVLGRVKAGDNPDAILYDPASRRALAFNGRSRDLTAVDAASGKAVGALALGGKPEFAAADGKGTIYVNVEDTAELVALDAAALKVKARWPLKPCAEPTGLALDPGRGRLYAVCGNGMMAVVDAASGKVLATPAIGARPDAAAFDPGLGLALSSNGEGTLTAVRGEDGFPVAAEVKTQPGARTMALDPATHRVYLVTADFDPAPAPTADQPRPRPKPKPGTFRVLVFAP